MTYFTKEQVENLQDQAKEIAAKVSNKEETIDIMAQLYVDGFEGRTLEQGRLVAETIIKTVQNFDVDYKEAQVDIDHFIRKFQSKIDKDKTCRERCNYWKQFATAVTGATIAMNNGSVNSDEIVKQLETLTVSEEEATPELENDLREQAFEALKNSNIMLGALAANVNTLKEIQNADEAAQVLIDLGNENIDYRAIISMIAYINAVNGEYPDVPIDISASQIANMVCVQIEQIKIIDALEHNDITMTVANSLLFILGVVAILKIAVLAAVAVIGFAPFLFGHILVIPACAVLIMGVIHFVGKGINEWEKYSKKIVITVVKSVRFIVSGGKKLFNFVKNTVMPDVLSRCKEIFSRMKNKVEDETVEVATEVSPA